MPQPLDPPRDPPYSDPDSIVRLDWGHRVELFGETGDFALVETNSGRRGYLRASRLQESDPKVYFEGTVAGNQRTGFFYGYSYGDFLEEMSVTVAGAVGKLPLRHVYALSISPDAIRITDGDQGVTDADDINCRFIFGSMPSIRSGFGVEVDLARSRFKGHLDVTRLELHD